jgi:peroxiredoxin Q/BCP
MPSARLRSPVLILAALAMAVLAALAACAARPAAPAVGAPAPEFRLQDQKGEWHALADYRGQWLVLYFYPKDQTPGCTTEACEVRDNLFAFRALGATVLGVSVDDVASHKEFAEKHSLPFPLLADSTKATTKRYGVLVKMLGVFELAQRDTFIIDPQGRIAAHFVKVDPKEHSAKVLAALKALKARATPPAPAAPATTAS